MYRILTKYFSFLHPYYNFYIFSFFLFQQTTKHSNLKYYHNRSQNVSKYRKFSNLNFRNERNQKKKKFVL